MPVDCATRTCGIVCGPPLARVQCVRPDLMTSLNSLLIVALLCTHYRCRSMWLCFEHTHTPPVQVSPKKSSHTPVHSFILLSLATKLREILLEYFPSFQLLWSADNINCGKIVRSNTYKVCEKQYFFQKEMSRTYFLLGLFSTCSSFLSQVDSIASYWRLSSSSCWPPAKKHHVHVKLGNCTTQAKKKSLQPRIHDVQVPGWSCDIMRYNWSWCWVPFTLIQPTACRILPYFIDLTENNTPFLTIGKT